jgi:hypothetical protein
LIGDGGDAGASSSGCAIRGLGGGLRIAFNGESDTGAQSLCCALSGLCWCLRHGFSRSAARGGLANLLRVHGLFFAAAVEETTCHDESDGLSLQVDEM